MLWEEGSKSEILRALKRELCHWMFKTNNVSSMVFQKLMAPLLRFWHRLHAKNSFHLCLLPV